MNAGGLRLEKGADRSDLIAHLADRCGGKAGVDAVLAALDRKAVATRIPATAADYGFRWDLADTASREWWPQGVTTSADASDVDDVRGRRVVVVGWYAKPKAGFTRGVRLSFVDVTDPLRPSYRHVLLVTPRRDEASGAIAMDPVGVHAGGIMWYGPSILVADTVGGVRVFDVDDILRVGAGDCGHLGHRFVLPQRTAFRAVHDEGFDPFRFSFLSVDRSGARHQLVAGEYGRGEQTTRLTRFALDPVRLTVAVADDGYATPLDILVDGTGGMQGATMVDDILYITASRGSLRRGTLWVRRPDSSMRAHEGVLTIGPEDLTYWPQRDRLWTVSEYPGMRFVYSMPRLQFE